MASPGSQAVSRLGLGARRGKAKLGQVWLWRKPWDPSWSGLEILGSSWDIGRGVGEKGLGWTPVPSLGCCVSLEKLLLLSEPQFWLLENKSNITYFMTILEGLSQL
jgi:hypothetical protein